MEIKCPNCGYEGWRSEFRYLCPVDSAGPDVYRLCPECKFAVYSEEIDITDASPGVKVWGMKAFGRRARRPSSKDEKNDAGVKGGKEDG